MHALGRAGCLSPFQLWLEAILSINAFAPASSREKEGTTHYCINVVLGLLIQAVEEVLNDQPFFYAVVWACLYVLLETLPDFRDSLIQQLLDSGDPVPEGIGFAHWLGMHLNKLPMS